MSLRIGISGTSGLIGIATVYHFKNRGIEIIDIGPYIRGQDNHSFTESLSWVIHLGARTSISQSVLNPVDTFADNLSSTANALSIAKRCGAAFLFMSTYVYGTPNSGKVSEDHPVKAHDPYTFSKIVCEELCSGYCALNKVPLIILRGFNIYGEKRVAGRLISDLLENIRLNQPLTIHVPNVVRDYVFVEDLVALFEKIVSSDKINEGIYNVGSGVGTSNLEVAETIKRLAGIKEEIVITGASRSFDVPAQIADVTRISSSYGWSAGTSLESGLGLLIQRLEKSKT